MSQYPEGPPWWEPPREPEPEREPDRHVEPEVERTRIDPFASPAPDDARPWAQRDQWGPPSSAPVRTRWEPVWAPPPAGEPVWGPPSGQSPPQPPLYASGRRDDLWGGRPLVGEERAWVPASHWLPLLTSWLGPLVLLLTIGERNARVREHARESLNFEITLWLGLLLSALLAHVLVGFLFLVLLLLLAVVLRIVATVESIRGRTHRYPFTLRIVR